MENKLIPNLYSVAFWFIKIRGIAIILLVASTAFVNHFLNISIREIPIYILSGFLFFLNVIYYVLLKLAEKNDIQHLISRAKQIIHIQISVDFVILTLILHFSGGVENPFIIYYIFHMIIVSTILSPLESYIQTGFALALIGSLAFLECFGIIPHYGLNGFISHNLYQNRFYLAGTGFVFVTTSLIVVYMANSIVARSRKTEEAYLKVNAELEVKDKLKNEYVLRVTHDVNGHLAAILGCLNVVKTKILGPLNEKQEEFVDRAYHRTSLLTNFVKDLLNLTKKRLENINETEVITVKEFIKKVISSIQVNAEDKSISLNVDIDNNINTITGHPFTLEELFSNLLFNAVKYTPENGTISLIIRNRVDHIIVEIADTGIGIPEDEVSKVFDEFYRASNVKKDWETGSGLGLSIVKQIIDTHKGRIWVESKVGTGTKFTFILPKNQAQEN